MKKKCDVCKKETNRTYRAYGFTLCSKHMRQYHKYGKFLDNNSRTVNDLNDYKIKGNIVIFNLYNQKNIKINEFIVDLEDIEKVKYKKWRISHNHVVTGSSKNQKELTHVLLNVDPNLVVDHINCNNFDNRKANLRICKQSENILNKSFMSNNTSEFIGVSYIKGRDLWDCEIRINYTRCHLGKTKNKEDAVYKRYYAEKLLFKEFEFTKNISDDHKKELEKIVIYKLKNKNLWQ